MAGSRVNATPLPLFSPVLPNTIACTLTAVPHSAGMLYLRRYTIARSFIQLPNTAPTAPVSCCHGSFGNALPVRSFTSFLNRLDQVLQVSVVSFVSSTSLVVKPLVLELRR